MPEVVTRYPQVLIKELKDAGGKCGEGAPQEILTTCPRENFCMLPTGEICVYDIKDISTMTQVNMSEWSEMIRGVPAMYSVSNVIVLVLIFGIGLLVGMKLVDRKK